MLLASHAAHRDWIAILLPTAASFCTAFVVAYFTSENVRRRALATVRRCRLLLADYLRDAPAAALRVVRRRPPSASCGLTYRNGQVIENGLTLVRNRIADDAARLQPAQAPVLTLRTSPDDFGYAYFAVERRLARRMRRSRIVHFAVRVVQPPHRFDPVELANSCWISYDARGYSFRQARLAGYAEPRDAGGGAWLFYRGERPRFRRRQHGAADFRIDARPNVALVMTDIRVVAIAA
jgi:hypothetical protein